MVAATFCGCRTAGEYHRSSKSRIDWVDEKNPPVKVGYDAVNQRLSLRLTDGHGFSGTDSNFNSFSVYGSATQTGINNLGLTNADNAQRVQIRGGEVLYGDSFVATGEEIQPNDKRYGIKVAYNSELQNFSISSGTTGEAIDANGAIGVTSSRRPRIFRLVATRMSETTGARTRSHMMLMPTSSVTAIIRCSVSARRRTTSCSPQAPA